MSILKLLYYIIIGPIRLFFEVVFSFASRLVGFFDTSKHGGLVLIVLSLAFNLLVLPLYLRADALQEEEKNTQERLKKCVDHIRKTFSGEERMMMLQTYYRQNDYNPVYTVKSAVSLLLQIPFFFAAYDFLSNLELLKGAAFGQIKDLSAPDGLLRIGALTINLLPIVMTLINVISGAIYTKGYPLKNKIQIYGIALFFLIFLYKSPSGLVFYWTMNNVFSLVKNIICKLDNKKKVIAGICSAAGLCFILLSLTKILTLTFNRRLLLIALGLALQLPAFYLWLRKKRGFEIKLSVPETDGRLFTIGTLLLSVLTGLLIPSAVIGASPLEFISGQDYLNPVWYVICAFCVAFGLFFLWFGVFFKLAGKKAKNAAAYAAAVLSVAALVNYMFFGRKLGTLFTSFKFERGMSFTAQQIVGNLLVFVICAVIVYGLSKNRPKLAKKMLTLILVAITAMSLWNVVNISRQASDASERISATKTKASFTFSKTGKNVFVLMMDRALGSTLPYIMNEQPELKEKFSGFTYYYNAVSFGPDTNFGSPPIYGGYEYTPIEMNSRTGESLMEKHNEALKVLPVLFGENGYDVTVCDPPYANYLWIPDLSIYDGYPNIHAYNTMGAFGESSGLDVTLTNRNLFCYGLMKTMVLPLQKLFYDSGNYYNPASIRDFVQKQSSMYTAEGLNAATMESYYVMENLPDITRIGEEESYNFVIMHNNLTHDTMMMQEPEYAPSMETDNTAYEKANQDRFTDGGRSLIMDDNVDYEQYQCNTAALRLISVWLDYLRENGVYDNTRIIIVADHGYNNGMVDELRIAFPDGSEVDASSFFPLFLFKDFGSQGYVESGEFMTNADVPAMAVQGLIEDPANPFTGKALDISEKNAHAQFILNDSSHIVDINNGNAFLPGTWYSVRDNIWDKSNWKKEASDAVLNRTNY